MPPTPPWKGWLVPYTLTPVLSWVLQPSICPCCSPDSANTCNTSEKDLTALGTQGGGPAFCLVLPAVSRLQCPWEGHLTVVLQCHGVTGTSAQTDPVCGHWVSPKCYKFSCFFCNSLHADSFSQKPLGNSLVTVKSDWWYSCSWTWSIWGLVPSQTVAIQTILPRVGCVGSHTNPHLWMGESRQNQRCLRVQKVCRFQTLGLARHLTSETEILVQGAFGEWKGNLIALLPSQRFWTVIGKAMQPRKTTVDERQPRYLPQDAVVILFSAWHLLASLREQFGSLVTLMWGDSSTISFIFLQSY